MITSSDPRVTYSDLQWPTVTLRWPILTLHTSSYLYLPHLVHTGLNPVDNEKYGWVVVVGGSTKFNVKHQGKDIHHPPSTIYKWPLSDLPRSTLCPSLSLSFTIHLLCFLAYPSRIIGEEIINFIGNNYKYFCLKWPNIQPINYKRNEINGTEFLIKFCNVVS